MTSSRKQTAAKAVARTKKSAAKKKRVRLSPEVRRQQILDAALIEFGAHGFSAATTAKIARRAGTTQSNLYVHFADKDEIFETLLKQVLDSSNSLWKPMQPGQNPKDVIDAFLEDTYSRLTPQAVAIIRLLISESHRVPTLVRRWHAEAVLPERTEQERRMNDFVAAGQLQDTLLSGSFSFLMAAPLLYAAVTTMVLPEDIAGVEFQRLKETHRKVLHLLFDTDANRKHVRKSTS